MPNNFLKKLAKNRKKEIEELEKKYKKSKSIASKKFKKDSKKFWKYTMGIFKRMLKINSESQKDIFSIIDSLLSNKYETSPMESSNSKKYYANNIDEIEFNKINNYINKIVSKFNFLYLGDKGQNLETNKVWEINRDDIRIVLKLFSKNISNNKLNVSISLNSYGSSPTDLLASILAENSSLILKICYNIENFMKGSYKDNEGKYFINIKDRNTLIDTLSKIRNIIKNYKFKLVKYVNNLKKDSIINKSSLLYLTDIEKNNAYEYVSLLYNLDNITLKISIKLIVENGKLNASIIAIVNENGENKILKKRI